MEKALALDKAVELLSRECYAHPQAIQEVLAFYLKWHADAKALLAELPYDEPTSTGICVEPDEPEDIDDPGEPLTPSGCHFHPGTGLIWAD